MTKITEYQKQFIEKLQRKQEARKPTPVTPEQMLALELATINKPKFRLNWTPARVRRLAR